jgi:hypothetical protein
MSQAVSRFMVLALIVWLSPQIPIALSAEIIPRPGVARLCGIDKTTL